MRSIMLVKREISQTRLLAFPERSNLQRKQKSLNPWPFSLRMPLIQPQKMSTRGRIPTRRSLPLKLAFQNTLHFRLSAERTLFGTVNVEATFENRRYNAAKIGFFLPLDGRRWRVPGSDRDCCECRKANKIFRNIWQTIMNNFLQDCIPRDHSWRPSSADS